MKQDLDLYTYHLQSSFKFIHPKAQDLFKKNLLLVITNSKTENLHNQQ